MSELKDINTFFFVDETKFSEKNSDYEDAIYYLGVAVDKQKISKINSLYDKLILASKMNKGFHATKVFKERNPNKILMTEFCNLIVENKLKCYCFKYSKSKLYAASKIVFEKYNSDILNFKNQEFQALFFFTQNLIKSLEKEDNFKTQGLLFCDRNVYGQNDIEGFDFEENLTLKRMIFTSRKKIKLLCLPDYFGFIFRKSKNSFNRAEFGDKLVEKSELTINCFDCLMKIKSAGLFKFLDMEKWLEEQSTNA